MGEQLAPATGWAGELRAGQRLRITDVDGQQVSDLVVFRGDDHSERLSQGNTRKLNGRWLLTTGSVLYSTKCAPLLSIVRDDVGRHDLQSSACSPYDYPIRFGITDHASCLAILTAVLEPYGIAEHLVPDPFNVFMHTTVAADDGTIEVHAPKSRSGDAIELRAEMNCLVALTVCPQDQNQCNGGTITPLVVEVLPETDRDDSVIDSAAGAG
jgi:uncharacterized protein YcgI (DUF1989 family)